MSGPNFLTHYSECIEIEAHLKRPNTKELEEELGDLLHASFSLCVFLQLDPKITLEKSVDKFERRFRKVQELAFQQGFKNLKHHSFSDLMRLWDAAKQQTDGI